MAQPTPTYPNQKQQEPLALVAFFIALLGLVIVFGSYSLDISPFSAAGIIVSRVRAAAGAVNILGGILGIVALVRLKRRGRSGTGLAVAAVALGMPILVYLVFLFVILSLAGLEQ